MARSGVCSRRNADLLIQSGRVEVNGVVAQKLGSTIDERQDRVSVDGKRVSLRENLLYILLNKPKGYLSTVRDSFRRPTVLDLIGKDQKVFPVGRLDKDTEGVLLLTNDGELTYRLTHPKFEVERTYLVTVKGELDQQILQGFKRGIEIEEGVIARGIGKIIQAEKGESIFELKLKEGRKREIRSMCHVVGLRVTHLTRIEFAHLTARGLKIGQWRHLTKGETTQLKKMVGLA
ncbi:MAG: pseudouridine synthase [Candidatus Zixiibacteriota bacterium]